MEFYKDVQDIRFIGRYKVSNLGNIISNNTGKKMIVAINNRGYKNLVFNGKNFRTSVMVHRVVAEAFIENVKNFPFVNHKDGNKLNNVVSNLEWCDHSINMKHAVKLGLLTNCCFRGDKHNTCKHSFKEVILIRKLYLENNITMRKLAKQFNCSSGYISDVINNKIRILE